MSVNPVDVQQLAVKYTTIKAATEALQKGELSTDNFQALLSFKHESEDNAFYGLQVEQNPASQELTSEQKEAKDKAKVRQEKEVEQMKAQAAAASTEDKVAQVKKGGVTTQEGVITSHGDGTAYTFDIKAPARHKEKTTKDAERARMARYYDEKSGEWIERGEKYKTNKEVRQALKAKEKEIKAEQKQAKKDAKQLNKDARAARTEASKYDAELERLLASGLTMNEILANPKYDDLIKKLGQSSARYIELESRSNDAIDRQMKAKEEREQVHQARVASGRTGFLKKTGVGADKRAYNANVKANNRLADRVVVRTEAEKDRIKDLPAYKDKKIKVASDDDIQVLKRLSVLARRYMDSASDPKEKSVWQELANLTTKDEHGRILFTANTKQVQDALIDITGGDMRLNYTEQKMLAKETGMSMSQVRHAFKTYAFEAPHPLGKRFTAGGLAALPVAADMTLGHFLSKRRASASGYAEATAEDHAVSDAHQTTIVEGDVTATAHSEASVPGYKFDWIDPYTGEEVHKRVAGQFAEDTQSVTQYYKAIAEANAHAEAHSKAFASVSVACSAVAKLSPAGLIAAPALAFLGGFLKTPVEISAAQAGATTEKMSKFVNVFKHNKNKNIGNQIIQMAGQITGNEAVDRALIVAVLDHDIGSQNTTPTLRELRNALAHLDAIKGEVDKFKKLPKPPAEEPPAQPPVQEPTQAPYCYDVKPGEVVKPNTHTVAKGDTVDMIIKAKYPDSDFRKAKAEFLKANPALKDPDSIQVGQEFVLPDVDGKAPKLDGKVRRAHGKRIIFRPSNIPGVNGEQMFDLYDCSDPKNEKKLNSKPMTHQAAEAEQTRLSADAQAHGRTQRKK